ncbi:MAG TPA: ABC transporter substrate-binding protein [Burkholderiales bacterium]|nr:ABC transporter substrate-binding protein [Burkholderiales bacterium]
MTTRRQVVFGAALAAFCPGQGLAQTRPVKIGMLSARPLAESVYASRVVKRLQELGYLRQRGAGLEFRSAGGDVARYPKLARELIDAKCDLIFAIGPPQAVLALHDAGNRVPIVFIAANYDPVKRGVVSSLRSPGGNVTGVYIPQADLAVKRMQIMLEIMPGARRLLSFADLYCREQANAVREAAKASGVQVTVIEFSRLPYDYTQAFDSGRKQAVQAYVGLSSSVFASDAAALASLLVKYRLPGAGSAAQQAEAGLLVSYGIDSAKVSRRAADIADRILKGATPPGIPVEQADEFELAINARTARALEVKIPESVLARATRIIT